MKTKVCSAFIKMVNVILGNGMQNLCGYLLAANIFLLFAAGCTRCSFAKREESTKPPNIVLILCDNLGYGDLDTYNPDAKQRTPRISQLASEGMTFYHAYSAAPVCTPSRAALMTGCYPRRIGLDDLHPVIVPVSKLGLNPDEITVAEILKQRGYTTMCIGKWHLGDQLEFLPTQQGFDQFFGIPYSDDMVENKKRGSPPLPLMRNNKVIEAPADVNLLTRRNTEEALRFMEQNRERPFFLYFPQITPGSTGSPPMAPEFRGKSGNGSWGDSVVELDWSTGKIMDKLQELGLTENTIIIWTNDNGAPAPDKRGGSNKPLKGNAYNISEGGMRVPFIVRWPGKIRAGSECSELISLMDVLPMAAALSAAPLPDDRKIDGHDISALLFEEEGSRSPYDAFFYYYLTQLQAVRSGEWKLYLPLEKRWITFRGDTKKSQGELYDLKGDPQETVNLFNDRPDVVKKLLAHAADIRSDLGELNDKGSGVRPVGIVNNPTPRLLDKD